MADTVGPQLNPVESNMRYESMNRQVHSIIALRRAAT
jgi:hypothetical protein